MTNNPRFPPEQPRAAGRDPDLRGRPAARCRRPIAGLRLVQRSVGAVRPAACLRDAGAGQGWWGGHDVVWPPFGRHHTAGVRARPRHADCRRRGRRGPAAEDAELVAWLRRRAAGARRVASVCTGAFLLAATGLLDGRRVATHWGYCERLAATRPALVVEKDPIFVVDGRYWTSAGVTAGIDLALAMVEADLGREMALAVARRLVVFLKRPGGQAQFSATLELQRHDRFAELHEWMRDRLAGDLTVPALAERAGMSERSLIRHYRAATGTTPARTVERLRVEAAAAKAERHRSVDQGDRAQLRLRLGGDHAPQLPAPDRGDAAVLSRAVQVERGGGLEPERSAPAATTPIYVAAWVCDIGSVAPPPAKITSSRRGAPWRRCRLRSPAGTPRPGRW